MQAMQNKECHRGSSRHPPPSSSPLVQCQSIPVATVLHVITATEHPTLRLGPLFTRPFHHAPTVALTTVLGPEEVRSLAVRRTLLNRHLGVEEMVVREHARVDTIGIAAFVRVVGNGRVPRELDSPRAVEDVDS